MIAPIALLKVFFLLSGALAVSIAWLPPTPEATQEKRDQVKADIGSNTTASYRGRNACKGFVWLIALCDAAVTIAAHYPSEASNTILKFLVAGPPLMAANATLTKTFLAGWVGIIAATAFRVASYRALGRLFTFELSIREDHKLITDGPYALVRHPSYTALYLLMPPMFACQLGPGSWALECGILKTPMGLVCASVWLGYMSLLCYVMAKRVNVEDEMLKEAFGHQWLEWAARTRYRLIPGIH